MKKYPLTAIVDRSVSDTIDLVVEAEDEGQAYQTARKVLSIFPDPHTDIGVRSCYIRQRLYQNNEVMQLIEQEDEGAGDSI